ncbi:hypothetical protein Pyn_35472 [Prunus yedoensis var. nudiflora]|uniref:RING-type E3 ubiquitin transferase n=1 Tax=Prunus yedoensis var. nudiflora TaxID=2094558 RepID=A0A314ULH4_PRUYE|nr:hypothetical protein Pyn_35472 [Prunus yedoensis var. nudiflora]
MSTETHLFRSTVLVTTESRETIVPETTVIQISMDDGFPISLKLFNRVRGRSGHPDLLTERGVTVPLSRLKLSAEGNGRRIRRRYRKVLAANLIRMGVPEDEHRGIIWKIFQAVDDVAIPGSSLEVRPTVTILMVMEELIGLFYCPKFPFPKPRSERVDALDRVMVRLEEKVRCRVCQICGEALDAPPPTPVGEEEEDHRQHQQKEGVPKKISMISRLPCSHLFHQDCIVQHWLRSSRRSRGGGCPVCQLTMLIKGTKDVLALFQTPSRSWGLRFMIFTGSNKLSARFFANY